MPTIVPGILTCEARAVLADLHLHLYGCIRPTDLLRHLASRDRIRWDWYEEHMRAAYGTVPPTREVVARYRAGDPEAEALFASLFVFGDGDAGNFDRFQAKFNLLIAGSAVGDRAAPLTDLEAEVAAFATAIRADHARNGVTYAETRLMLGPTLSGPRDRAVLDAVLAGYARPDGTTTERLALSLNRQDPWAAWDRVRELALGPHGATVTGVDFCHVEEGFPPKDKAEFFAAVHDFNAQHPDRALAILYHVGESFRDKSLESAVRWVQEIAELGANRLGHAIALGIDPAVFGPHSRIEPVGERRDQIAYDLANAAGLRAVGVPVDEAALRAELTRLPHKGTVAIEYDDARLELVRRRQRYAMSRVRAAGAVVEVCPTSNRRIGGITDPAHHPVHRFLDAGLAVVVASDDPGIFGTTLADELDWVCAQTGGGDQLREHLVDTAWRSRSEVLTGRES
jgi:adenosine deaminase